MDHQKVARAQIKSEERRKIEARLRSFNLYSRRSSAENQNDNAVFDLSSLSQPKRQISARAAKVIHSEDRPGLHTSGVAAKQYLTAEPSAEAANLSLRTVNLFKDRKKNKKTDV